MFTPLKVKHIGVVALLSMWDVSLQRGVALLGHTTVCPLQDIEEPDDDDELEEDEELEEDSPDDPPEEDEVVEVVQTIG